MDANSATLAARQKFQENAVRGFASTTVNPVSDPDGLHEAVPASSLTVLFDPDEPASLE
jgi:hypothetical protein